MAYQTRETTPGVQPNLKKDSPRSLIPSLHHIGLVVLGGMLGATARVAFTHLFTYTQNTFPWVTFAENILGAFLLGLLIVLLHERWRAPRRLHPFLCTGILGSFTTFSTFSVEAVELIQAGQPFTALFYAALSIALGLAAALLGIRLGYLSLKWSKS